MTLNRENHINSIVSILDGLTFGDQLAILAATISVFAVQNQTSGVSADKRNMAPEHRKVPGRSKGYSRFDAVWNYLEKIPEFDTVGSLRRELAAHFGEENTPSVTHLHRYLQANDAPGLARKGRSIFKGKTAKR